MGGIIYDARRIKAYEYMQGLGAMTGKPQDFIDSLWKEIVMDGDLMKEFAYYLDHHTFLNEFKVNGYGLLDLYMWLMRRYNFLHDYGRNDGNCDKEALVLDTFWHMVKMKDNPEEYEKQLEDGFGLGMDQM